MGPTGRAFSSVIGAAFRLARPRSEARINSEDQVIVFSAWAFSCTLVLLALLLDPVISGDGHYYYGMLRGLAVHGSPELTDDVIANVMDVTGRRITGGVFETSTGGVYGIHFFFYPLLCVPSYWGLELLGLNPLKAFQLTNAFLTSAAIFAIVRLKYSNRLAKILVIALFLGSTGSYYLQFTSTEIYSATLLVVSAAMFLERRYSLAVLLCGFCALQNPSAILFCGPILFGYWMDLRKRAGGTFLSVKIVVELIKAGLPSLIGLVPYVWFKVLSGHTSMIVARGYIDYDLIGLRRFSSFLFDLNQGLIVGAPALIFLVPAVLVIRLVGVKSLTLAPKRADLLLVGFILVALPTLGQVNWNAGLSVYLRYAAWISPILMVWAASEVTDLSSRVVPALIIPAGIVQFLAFGGYGGYSLPPLLEHTSLRPWVVDLWQHNPRLYNPDTDIFIERVSSSRRRPVLPIVFRDERATILKILSNDSPVEEVSAQICPEDGSLRPLNTNMGSSLRSAPANRAVQYFPNTRLTYVTGRLGCVLEDWGDATLPFKKGNSSEYLIPESGWSRFEDWGRWTNGGTARLRLFARTDDAEAVRVAFSGKVFCPPDHPTQRIYVYVNGQRKALWTIERESGPVLDPQAHFIEISGDELSTLGNAIEIEFRLPDAISPDRLGVNSDGRYLALGLSEVHIQKVVDSEEVL